MRNCSYFNDDCTVVLPSVGSPGHANHNPCGCQFGITSNDALHRELVCRGFPWFALSTAREWTVITTLPTPHSLECKCPRRPRKLVINLRRLSEFRHGIRQRYIMTQSQQRRLLPRGPLLHATNTQGTVGSHRRQVLCHRSGLKQRLLITARQPAGEELWLRTADAKGDARSLRCESLPRAPARPLRLGQRDAGPCLNSRPAFAPMGAQTSMRFTCPQSPRTRPL